MTREELRVTFNWFCGCGSPEDAYRFVRDVLALHPLYDHRKELKALIPDDGMEMFALYALSHFDLTEHGGSVGGGWLTKKGEEALAALQREAADNFLTLGDANCCIHGFADGVDCPDCGGE